MIIKDLKIQPGDKSFTFTEQCYNITDSKQYPNIEELRIADNVTKIDKKRSAHPVYSIKLK